MRIYIIFLFITVCFFCCNNKHTIKSKKLTGNDSTEIVERRENKNLKKLHSICKDTLVVCDNKQIHIKYELINLDDLFIVSKSFGENGNEIIQKIPEKRIKKNIEGLCFLINKHDISELDTNFLKKSVFQKIDFYSFSENVSTFEVTLGEPDTDNIVFIYITIDKKGNKSFRIEYPEWDE